jgi:hypothetical protein
MGKPIPLPTPDSPPTSCQHNMLQDKHYISYLCLYLNLLVVVRQSEPLAASLNKPQTSQKNFYVELFNWATSDVR